MKHLSTADISIDEAPIYWWYQCWWSSYLLQILMLIFFFFFFTDGHKFQFIHSRISKHLLNCYFVLTPKHIIRGEVAWIQILQQQEKIALLVNIMFQHRFAFKKFRPHYLNLFPIWRKFEFCITHKRKLADCVGHWGVKNDPFYCIWS